MKNHNLTVISQSICQCEMLLICLSQGYSLPLALSLSIYLIYTTVFSCPRHLGKPSDACLIIEAIWEI